MLYIQDNCTKDLNIKIPVHLESDKVTYMWNKNNIIIISSRRSGQDGGVHQSI